MYPNFILLLIKSSNVLFIARGDASRVVNVVLNIVVKTAIVMIKLLDSPKFFVYNLISCNENMSPELLNCSPEPNITSEPKNKNATPKTTVPKYPILKSNIVDFL